jgi:hypothetical protein
MITAFLAAQSALALTLARARKRASVVRTMSLGGADSAPLRLLSRSLIAHTQRASRLERALAKHLAITVRDFVQSGAFEALLLAGITRILSRILKGGTR